MIWDQHDEVALAIAHVPSRIPRGPRNVADHCPVVWELGQELAPNLALPPVGRHRPNDLWHFGQPSLALARTTIRVHSSADRNPFPPNRLTRRPAPG